MPHLAVFSARVEAGARHAMLHPRAGLVALIAAVASACAWAAPASAAGLDVPVATGNVAHVGSHAVDTTLAAAPAVIERATPTVARAATALEPARPVAEPVVKSVTRGVASEIPAVAGRTADSVTTAVDRPQREDPVRTPASAAPVRAPAGKADPAPRGPRLSGNERTAATAPAAIGSRPAASVDARRGFAAPSQATAPAETNTPAQVPARLPDAPAVGSGSSAGAGLSTTLLLGGLALLATALCLAGPGLSRRLETLAVAWRPPLFVSLLERPG